MKRENRKSLPLLTSLRFFAATEVVVFHHKYMLPIESDLLLGLTSAGYQSVTFFFVLSGFILSYVYLAERESDFNVVNFREFLNARIERLLPSYILSLLILFPYFINQGIFQKAIPTIDFTLGLILVPLFLQAWWPPTTFLWNMPAWSLSVEIFFYILFPSLLIASNYLNRTNFILLSYGLVVLVSLGQFHISSSNHVPHFWETFALYSPIANLPQFIFGLSLGRVYLFSRRISSMAHLSMFCVGILMLLSVFGLRLLLPLWMQENFVLVILFSLIIYGAALPSVPNLFILRVFGLLGQASYSIYILHIPISFWWLWVANQLSLNLSSTISFVVYFILLICISVISFLYVEPFVRKYLFYNRNL